jgi:hypothetical protein
LRALKVGRANRDRRFGTVAFGHLGGVGFDPMAAIEAPRYPPDFGRSGVGERHRWKASISMSRAKTHEVEFLTCGGTRCCGARVNVAPHLLGGETAGFGLDLAGALDRLVPKGTDQPVGNGSAFPGGMALQRHRRPRPTPGRGRLYRRSSSPGTGHIDIDPPRTALAARESGASSDGSSAAVTPGHLPGVRLGPMAACGNPARTALGSRRHWQRRLATPLDRFIVSTFGVDARNRSGTCLFLYIRMEQARKRALPLEFVARLEIYAILPTHMTMRWLTIVIEY